MGVILNKTEVIELEILPCKICGKAPKEFYHKGDPFGPHAGYHISCCNITVYHSLDAFHNSENDCKSRTYSRSVEKWNRIMK